MSKLTYKGGVVVLICLISLVELIEIQVGSSLTIQVAIARVEGGLDSDSYYVSGVRKESAIRVKRSTIEEGKDKFYFRELSQVVVGVRKEIDSNLSLEFFVVFALT